ncbi:MAG: EutN/CcmL family microcompartment protein [Candidatus Marinimicrobia bacterium]|nr:EutN/CcmL family microcompartment protein [Candidatus Neomarinimicrobiota bacterium]
MILAKVIGSIVATVKNVHFEGKKLMIVKSIHPNGSVLQESAFLAVDHAQAGIDDIVLINREGSGARLLLENDAIPVQSVIVGIIDNIEVFND